MGIREDLNALAEAMRSRSIPPPARSVVGLVDGPLKGQFVTVSLIDIQHVDAASGTLYLPCGVDHIHGLSLMSCDPERWYRELPQSPHYGRGLVDLEAD